MVRELVVREGEDEQSDLQFHEIVKSLLVQLVE